MASPETSGSFQYQSTFMSYGFKPYGFKKASPDKTNIYWKALQHQEDYSTLSTNIKKACTDTVNYYDAKYNAVARYATYFHPKGVTAIVIGLQRDESIPGFHQDTYIVAFPATSSNKKWGVANKEIDNKSKLDALLSTINHPLYGKLTDPMSKYISYDDVEEQVTRRLQECVKMLRRIRRKM